MEKETKRRGRPATGKVRNIKIGVNVTEDERNFIKEYLKKNNITITDFIIKSIKENK